MLLIGLSVVVIVVLGGLFAWFSADKVELDDAFCPLDGPASVTAVMIDQTDQLNATQQSDVRNRLETIRDSIPKFGRLAIYTVGSDFEGLSAPDFALCNPGSGEELSRWIANPDLARRRWSTVFDKPLRAAFDAAISANAADQSPIFESIQALALAEFARLDDNAAKQLIVVSDLLQHTRDFTLYVSDPHSSDFERLAASSYYGRIRTDLKGAAITILFLRRSAGLARWPKAHLGFWRDFLLDQGVGDLKIVAVQG